MLAASTCHLVLQWLGSVDLILDKLWYLAGDQATRFNEPAAPDNDHAEFVASMGSFYLPMINVSLSVSLFLTLVDHFAVCHERWNCALEGMDHVGTQCESLDISCAIISSIHW